MAAIQKPLISLKNSATSWPNRPVTEGFFRYLEDFRKVEALP